MKKISIIILSIPAGIFLFLNFQTEQEYKYVGSKQCHTCHKLEKYGNQTAKWMAGPHAKAFKGLGSDFAKKHEANIGIDVTGTPQKSKVCLNCHSTAGAPDDNLKTTSYSNEEGVGCEGCHGPGSVYKEMTNMQSTGKVSQG